MNPSGATSRKLNVLNAGDNSSHGRLVSANVLTGADPYA
jgi:hypothetical protein